MVWAVVSQQECIGFILQSTDMQVKLISDSKLLHESECVSPSCDELGACPETAPPIVSWDRLQPPATLQVMVMDIGHH